MSARRKEDVPRAEPNPRAGRTGEADDRPPPAGKPAAIRPRSAIRPWERGRIRRIVRSPGTPGFALGKKPRFRRRLKRGYTGCSQKTLAAVSAPPVSSPF
jgi:hypothetical protein